MSLRVTGSDALFQLIRQKRSFLCVGLDTDVNHLPSAFLGHRDPIFAFNRAIVEATADYAVAYKPNLAFYEGMGNAGWDALGRTVAYIKEYHPNVLTIADGKRGDVSHTASRYARSIFRELDFDAVTLSPYLGYDSIAPFLEYEDRWVIILALTSNPSYSDFQLLPSGAGGDPLFVEVLARARGWGHEGNMMFVVGAHRMEHVERVRSVVPGHFLLVPGVGAQGGDLRGFCKVGLNRKCGLLVNASRSIIYADSTLAYADAARLKAHQLQQEMESILVEAGLVEAVEVNE